MGRRLIRGLTCCKSIPRHVCVGLNLLLDQCHIFHRVRVQTVLHRGVVLLFEGCFLLHQVLLLLVYLLVFQRDHRLRGKVRRP